MARFEISNETIYLYGVFAVDSNTGKEVARITGWEDENEQYQHGVPQFEFMVDTVTQLNVVGNNRIPINGTGFHVSENVDSYRDNMAGSSIPQSFTPAIAAAFRGNRNVMKGSQFFQPGTQDFEWLVLSPYPKHSDADEFVMEAVRGIAV